MDSAAQKSGDVGTLSLYFGYFPYFDRGRSVVEISVGGDVGTFVTLFR